MGTYIMLMYILNIINISILLNLTYRFSPILCKIPIIIFVALDKLILTCASCMQKCMNKRLKIDKTYFKRGNKMEDMSCYMPILTKCR